MVESSADVHFIVLMSIGQGVSETKWTVLSLICCDMSKQTLDSAGILIDRNRLSWFVFHLNVESQASQQEAL